MSTTRNFARVALSFLAALIGLGFLTSATASADPNDNLEAAKSNPQVQAAGGVIEDCVPGTAAKIKAIVSEEARAEAIKCTVPSARTAAERNALMAKITDCSADAADKLGGVFKVVTDGDVQKQFVFGANAAKPSAAACVAKFALNTVSEKEAKQSKKGK